MRVMKWISAIAVICVAYAIAAFCQATYVLVIAPRGHMGGGFDVVLRYFLEAPVSLVTSYLEIGLTQTMIVQGVIFFVIFFAVTGGALWWSKREKGNSIAVK
jgi:hypothetical protein